MDLSTVSPHLSNLRIKYRNYILQYCNIDDYKTEARPGLRSQYIDLILTDQSDIHTKMIEGSCFVHIICH